MTALRIVFAIAAIALSYGGAAAQTKRTTDPGIGRVIAPPVKAELRAPPGAYERTEKGATVPVGGSVKTADGGNADLFLFDTRDPSRIARAKQSVALLEGTELAFETDPENTDVLNYRLSSGAVRWVGQQKTVSFASGDGKDIVRALGTAFIVRYEPTTATMEVLGVSGEASVTGTVAGVTIPVLRQQLATVVAGGRPRIRTLTDDEMFRYIRPFELLRGGKTESQVVDDPALLGTAVPEPERAPAGSQPAAPRDEGTWRERGPFIDQPPPVIDSTDLGIQF